MKHVACWTLRSSPWILAVSLATGIAFSQELREETEISIRCRLPDDAARSSPFLRQHSWLAPQPGEYTYKLWLPPGYLADTTRRWPCLFIASPGGDAKMGRMADWIRQHKFIAIMLVESRNGPWGPIVGNFLAAHDDAVQRLRIQEGLKWATGMSGGARAASVFAQCRPGFSAVILQAAGFAQGPDAKYVADVARANNVVVAMCMGRNDRNRSEAAAIRSVIGSRLFRAFEFDGGHEWAPAEVFAQAADWAWAMVCQEGPPNPALKDYYVQVLADKLKEARAKSDAWARYRGLSDAVEYARSRDLARDPKLVSELQAATSEMTRLRNDPAVARQAQAHDALARLRQSGSRIPPAMLRMQLQAFLQQYSGTEAAEEAQRLLNELGDASKSGRGN
jgi:hypothetical protein